MSEYAERLENYSTAAAPVINRLSRDGVEALSLADAQVPELNALLAAAFMEGVQAGEAEVLAVAAEQGIDVKIEKLRAPE